MSPDTPGRVNATTGQIIAEHTIDPNHDYQPKKP